MIYLDSVFCIRLVDTRGDFHIQAIQTIQSNMGQQLATSDLGFMECLIRPLRDRDYSAEHAFRSFFDSTVRLPITSAMFERAARLRADHKSLRTPDALHLAIAQESGCSAVWTGDIYFARTSPDYVFNVFAR